QGYPRGTRGKTEPPAQRNGSTGACPLQDYREQRSAGDGHHGAHGYARQAHGAVESQRIDGNCQPAQQQNPGLDERPGAIAGKLAEWTQHQTETGPAHGEGTEGQGADIRSKGGGSTCGPPEQAGCEDGCNATGVMLHSIHGMSRRCPNEKRALRPFSVSSATQEAEDCNLERETRLELATPTLARSCSTN